MGKGSQNSNNLGLKNSDFNENLQSYTWEQVKEHNRREDLWIVLNDNVYNVTEFQKKHPGGSKLISFYAGKDATEPFLAYHKDMKMTQKYLKIYRIGKLADTIDNSQDKKIRERNDELKKDFEELRQKAIQMNLFETNFIFFGLMFLHVVFFHALGYYLLIKYGSGIIPYTLSIICHVIGHMQSAWISHDSGHLSVFKSSKANHFFQSILMCCFKGVSHHWWNNLHYTHHTVTNLIGKDGDVTVSPLMVLGKEEPVKVAEKNFKAKKAPFISYKYQDKLFYVLAALLIPVYFELSVYSYVKKRKLYKDFLMLAQMYIVFLICTVPTLGFTGSIVYFFLMRATESCWYTWITQMNHIPMIPRYDDESDCWLTLQLRGTCNVEKSFFNDWFTGHLNFQIEHHLFPTMPRHNYYKIQPYVKDLCQKHKIDYIVKPLGTALKDIVMSLQTYGEIWSEAYQNLSDSD